MDIKETYILKEAVNEHWYYKSKFIAVLSYLKNIHFKEILDVGAGSGFFAEQLLIKSVAQKAICVDTAYQQEEEKFINGKLIEFKKELNKTDAQLVLLIDVLEHTENDEAFLKEYMSKVENSTYFLIAVPAHQFLFSKHDEYLGHYRRYNMNSLKKLVEKSGLEILKIDYFFFLILLLVMIVRLTKKFLIKSDVLNSDLRRHSKIVNIILYLIHKLELKLFSSNKLTGLTIFCLAKKV